MHARNHKCMTRLKCSRWSDRHKVAIMMIFFDTFIAEDLGGNIFGIAPCPYRLSTTQYAKALKEETLVFDTSHQAPHNFFHGHESLAAANVNEVETSELCVQRMRYWITSEDAMVSIPMARTGATNPY